MILIIRPILTMADTSTSDNFFVKFSPKSGFATKRLSLWKEWTYSIIQDLQRWLLRNFVHCFQRQFHICLGYETLSFLFLEQCFQSSLWNEIWCPFFDINNFSIIPKCISFDNDNLPITWMPIYRRLIIFFDNNAHT